MRLLRQIALGVCLAIGGIADLSGIAGLPGTIAWPSVSYVLSVIDGLGQTAHAQQRRSFTFSQPDPGTDDAGDRQARAAKSGVLRDVAWFLHADGDWNVQMQGQGLARVTGVDQDGSRLIRVTLEHEDGGPPIRFFVKTRDPALDYVYFTQTGDHPVSAAGIHSLGSNYLESEGRQVRSLRGNGNPGSLANHDGLVRVDQREDGLLINFSAMAVFCERIREGPFNSEPPCGGRHYLSSKPGKIGMVRGCIVALDQLQANPDACLQPFQVDRVTPVDERENVNFKDPGLEVVFSDRIKPSTLESGFDLFTYAPDGKELAIAGQWQREGPTTYRFVPDVPLYSGTTYIARVAAGRDGVESKEGAWLEEPYEWRFSSLLDLDGQAPEDEVPVRLHNYQVIRDGKLTVDKPTLTRAFVTWRLHDEVAQDMQPESFRLQFEPSDRYGRWVGQRDALPVSDAVRVWRYDDPEQFSDEDRRHAQQTVNLFGWKPRGSGTQTFTVRAHDPYPAHAEPVEHKAEKEYEVWQHDPGELNIYYTYAIVGQWGSGVPADVQSHLLRALFLAEDYVPQYLPYRGAQARFIGSPPSFVDFLISMFRDPATLAAWVAFGKFEQMTAPDGSGNGAGGQVAANLASAMNPATVAARIQHALAKAQHDSPASNAAQILLGAYMRYVQDILSDRISRNDMLVMFIPPGYLPEDSLGRGISHADSALYHGMLLDFRVRSVVMRIDSGFAADALGVGLVHEFGHTFGLAHNPGDSSVVTTDEPYSNEPIEGFKIAKDGLDGWNKSSAEGNAQSDHLASLMWPRVLEPEASLMTESEYQQVQSAIETPFDRRSSLQPTQPPWSAGYKPYTRWARVDSRWPVRWTLPDGVVHIASAQRGGLRPMQAVSDADPGVGAETGMPLGPASDVGKKESLLLSGAIFEEAGIVMLYPAARGGYDQMFSASPFDGEGHNHLRSDEPTSHDPEHTYWIQLRDEHGGVLHFEPLSLDNEPGSEARYKHERQSQGVEQGQPGEQDKDHKARKAHKTHKTRHEWMMPAMPESWRHFRQTLPIDLFANGQVRAVVIGKGSHDHATLHDGSDLAVYRVPSEDLTPPTVRKDGDVLRWASVGEDVGYQVSYRVGSGDAWQVAVFRQTDTLFDLRSIKHQTRNLWQEQSAAERGGSIQIRVSTTDGFRYADTIVEIAQAGKSDLRRSSQEIPAHSPKVDWNALAGQADGRFSPAVRPSGRL